MRLAARLKPERRVAARTAPCAPQVGPTAHCGSEPSALGVILGECGTRGPSAHKRKYVAANPSARATKARDLVRPMASGGILKGELWLT